MAPDPTGETVVFLIYPENLSCLLQDLKLFWGPDLDGLQLQNTGGLRPVFLIHI